MKASSTARHHRRQGPRGQLGGREAVHLHRGGPALRALVQERSDVRHGRVGHREPDLQPRGGSRDLVDPAGLGEVGDHASRPFADGLGDLEHCRLAVDQDDGAAPIEERLAEREAHPLGSAGHHGPGAIPRREVPHGRRA